MIVSTLNDFQVLALLDSLAKVNHTQVYLLGGDTIKTTLLKGAPGMIRGLMETSPSWRLRVPHRGSISGQEYRAKFKVDPAYGHYTYAFIRARIRPLPSAARKLEAQRRGRCRTKIDGYTVTGSMKWDNVGEQRYGVIACMPRAA